VGLVRTNCAGFWIKGEYAEALGQADDGEYGLYLRAALPKDHRQGKRTTGNQTDHIAG